MGSKVAVISSTALIFSLGLRMCLIFWMSSLVQSSISNGSLITLLGVEYRTVMVAPSGNTSSVG